MGLAARLQTQLCPAGGTCPWMLQRLQYLWPELWTAADAPSEAWPGAHGEGLRRLRRHMHELLGESHDGATGLDPPSWASRLWLQQAHPCRRCCMNSQMTTTAGTCCVTAATWLWATAVDSGGNTLVASSWCAACCLSASCNRTRTHLSTKPICSRIQVPLTQLVRVAVGRASHPELNSYSLQ